MNNGRTKRPESLGLGTPVVDVGLTATLDGNPGENVVRPQDARGPEYTTGTSRDQPSSTKDKAGMGNHVWTAGCWIPCPPRSKVGRE